jgi:rubrerythrin
MDCLGERLGFERTGTRLYDALIAKRVAAGALPGAPARADLERLREDELRHFELLTETVTRLGGDPTVMTPAADVAGVEAMGLLQVVTDPRTTFEQALHAILVAELADNDGWRSLIELCQGVGQDALIEPFKQAQQEEDRHLREVRAWLTALKRNAVGIGPSA